MTNPIPGNDEPAVVLLLADLPNEAGECETKTAIVTLSTLMGVAILFCGERFYVFGGYVQIPGTVGCQYNEVPAPKRLTIVDKDTYAMGRIN